MAKRLWIPDHHIHTVCVPSPKCCHKAGITQLYRMCFYAVALWAYPKSHTDQIQWKAFSEEWRYYNSKGYAILKLGVHKLSVIIVYVGLGMTQGIRENENCAAFIPAIQIRSVSGARVFRGVHQC